MDGGSVVLMGEGGGAPSDGSTTGGSILTSNHNQDTVMSAEVSSPYPVDDDNLELGLGLSIGGGCGGSKSKAEGQYAKDFTSLISKPNPLSSSCFKNPNSSTCGPKRSASASDSSVVGWPPIRKGHRLANQTKLPDEQSSSTAEGNKSIGNDLYSQTKKVVANKRQSYLPVKVNMDGSLIGRKVDLNAHSSYEMLAQTLEDMFCRRWSTNEGAGPSKLLDGTSEFVLTYEDKDGDCMLAGDVPWRMFLGSVKRLRIIRNSDSNKPSLEKNATGDVK